MKMNPGVVSGHTVSSAEKKMFQRLKGILNPEWVAIHSLNLAEHQYKRWGEADFIVVAPEGVLVIEVKGGRVARNDQGFWEYTDRFGGAHLKAESPFKQAEGAMLSVRNFINGQLPSNKASGISYGYGVAFPDIDFLISSPEWASEQVGSSFEVGKDSSSLHNWIRKLYAYWAVRNRSTQMIDVPTLRMVAESLRPQFEVLPSLSRRIRGAVDELNLATLEQVAVLDGLAENKHLIVVGGAGAGKTVLGAELARRMTARNQISVGVLAPRAQALIPYMQLKDSVKLMHDKASIEPVDFLIVDEGQDLMNDEGLDLIDSAVIGGYLNGKWAILLDPNEQANFRGLFKHDAYAFILQLNHGMYKLSRNLRNTNQIAAVIRDVTGADIGVDGGGNGPNVDFQTILSADDFSKAINRELAKMLAAGIKAGECVVIALGDESIRKSLDKMAINQGVTVGVWHESDASIQKENVVRVVSPENFQGLEASCAIVGPFTDVGRPLDSSLYVSLSRAIAHLVLVGTEGGLAKLVKLGRQSS